MADTLNNKPKLQLGSGFVKNGPGSPATPSKLLINHGKPNFTIQRSPQANEQRKFAPENGNDVNKPTLKSITTETNNTNNNENVVLKNTKLFGVLNNVDSTTIKNQPEVDEELANGNGPKVALRRTATIPPLQKSSEDENVPEFILRQREIQKRLAKDNVLDFENRRSGYFTHVLISPTSTSPTSFAETMSSPRINPALEIPAPAQENSISPIIEKPIEAHKEEAQNVIIESKEESENVPEEETKISEEVPKVSEEVIKDAEEVKIAHEEVTKAPEHHLDDEEVANAIEEVNKALAGEDADNQSQQIEESLEHDHVEPHVVEVVETKVEVNGLESSVKTAEVHVPSENVEVEVTANEEPKQNGHSIDENNNDGDTITISHTNGVDGPHIPAADPSGVLGVNYGPKTVVSFSQELGSGENKYPDMVKVDVEQHNTEDNAKDSELKALTKVKFDIKTDENDIQVIPVVHAE